MTHCYTPHSYPTATIMTARWQTNLGVPGHEYSQACQWLPMIFRHAGTLDCSSGTPVLTRVFQTKSSRSALKVTTHIFSACFAMVAESWNTGTLTLRNPHWGHPTMVSAKVHRGRIASVSVAALLSLTCLKMKMSVFQCSSRQTTSADRAGNLRKHTFRRFQFWNPGTLTGTTSVPVCSSVPAVGQIGQLVKAAGTGRGNLRARTARSRGVDRHHLIRSGSWVVNQQVGRPASTDRGPGRRSWG
eukprot:COSAG03_NODE_1445_length_4071_cov_82.462739_2_plen_244_part_00